MDSEPSSEIVTKDQADAYRKSLVSQPWLSRLVIVYTTGKVYQDYDPEKAKCKTRPQHGMWWFGDAENGQMVGSFDDQAGTGLLEAVPIVDRPHALWLRKQNVFAESFAFGGPHYKKIQSRKKDKDNRTMWGGDVLLYIPSINEFCTYFCHTTNRKATGELADPETGERGNKVTLVVTPSTGGGNRWFVCRILAQLDSNGEKVKIELPAEDLAEALSKFANVSETVPEEWAEVAAPDGVVR